MNAAASRSVEVAQGRTAHILAVGDTAMPNRLLQQVNGRAVVHCAADAETALMAVATQHFDAILLDGDLPAGSAGHPVGRIRPATPTPIIVLTAAPTVDGAVQAMKHGAFDYVAAPLDLETLLALVARATADAGSQRQGAAPRRAVDPPHRFPQVIGRSAAMQAVLTTVARVAPLRSTVLLTGESGTGKEVIARTIHEHSPRAGGPLVAINCAAIPVNLLESELFGHERGAFTDAHARKPGHFEAADRGTMFLDEIGEMNPATQAKLLRVLERGTFTRVGGYQPVTVDVRVIAATNRDLDRSLQDGSFRPDLYFRLNVVSIHLPPLRERREDLPPLIRHFLACKSAELGVPEKPFEPDALDALTRYGWPGNVRELENAIERALALAHGSILTRGDLPEAVIRGLDTAAALPPSAGSHGVSLLAALRQFEYSLIVDALARAQHNQTRAAALLGTSRQLLKYRMTKLGIASE
jgi:DNA-binding NtrC family response regulator